MKVYDLSLMLGEKRESDLEVRVRSRGSSQIQGGSSQIQKGWSQIQGGLSQIQATRFESDPGWVLPAPALRFPAPCFLLNILHRASSAPSAVCFSLCSVFAMLSGAFVRVLRVGSLGCQVLGAGGRLPVLGVLLGVKCQVPGVRCRVPVARVLLDMN